MLGFEPRARPSVMFSNRADKSDLQVWNGQRGELWLLARMHDTKRRRGDVMWVVSQYVCDFDAAYTLASMRGATMSPMKDSVDYNSYVVCKGD